MYSLPPILPRQPLWPLPALHAPTQTDSNLHNPPNNPTAQTTAQQPRRPTFASACRTSLASLNADEAAIHQRKLNIQRFGAAWIRPPGVAKTYQQRMDEEAERIEQAELARREAQLADLALAEQQAAAQVDGPAEDGAAEGEEDGERDLDADVPDADVDLDSDEEDDGDDDDEDLEEITELTEEADVTFNEDSLLEGSELMPQQYTDENGHAQEDEEQALNQRMIALEEAELDGRLQEERDLGLDRDLDDDVPEAGSYEHTDSDEEFSSSEEETTTRTALRTGGPRFRRADSPVPRSAAAPPQSAVRRLHLTGISRPSPQAARQSIMTDDSEFASSSFMESSPVLARRHGNGNSIRARQQQGRRRLGDMTDFGAAR